MTDPSASLGSEAKRQAESYWTAKLIRCGDSYYGIDEPLPNQRLLYQLKEPNVTVISLPITEADKLNGIEFLGVTSFSPKVYRLYSPNNGWGAWHDGGSNQDSTNLLKDVPLSAVVGKKKGKWDVISIGEHKREIIKAACSEIPQ
ncbi:MAG TPA: hypothetical protein VGB73_04960 [Pyrinomonadaceae bacterium]|jgi:hypothetical protein